VCRPNHCYVLVAQGRESRPRESTTDWQVRFEGRRPRESTTDWQVRFEDRRPARVPLIHPAKVTRVSLTQVAVRVCVRVHENGGKCVGEYAKVAVSVWASTRKWR
jgi:hypothetical protein